MDTLDEAVEAARRIGEIAETLKQTPSKTDEDLMAELRRLVDGFNDWLGRQ